TIGPACFLWQADRRLGADGVPRGGAELERLEPVAEQIDVIDGLRALVAAIGDACGEGIAAIAFAKRDVFRPQRDPHLVADLERMEQIALRPENIALEKSDGGNSFTAR